MCVCVKWRIARAPLAKVHFADFYIADQLNSLNYVLPDLAYFICFYVTFIDTQLSVKPAYQNITLPSSGDSPLFRKFQSHFGK